MKIIVTTFLFVMIFSAEATAAEPGAKAAAKDHVLGRVFMSSAERRQLDLLRKSIPAEQSGPVNADSQSTGVPRIKKRNPVGYIVPSRGSPYQWVDGDFRHVKRADVDATNISQSIEIVRHENESVRDDRSPDGGEPDSEQGKRLEAEAGNANRSEQ